MAVAAVLMTQAAMQHDLEGAGGESDAGPDMMRVIRAVRIIKRFFIASKNRDRLDHRRLGERVLFDAELQRGLCRMAIQVLIFCLLIQVLEILSQRTLPSL